MQRVVLGIAAPASGRDLEVVEAAPRPAINGQGSGVAMQLVLNSPIVLSAIAGGMTFACNAR